MILRGRFSWIVLSCLIAAAAFVAGCSLDSGNPVAPTVGDVGDLGGPNEIANQPQFVRFAQPTQQALARGVPDQRYDEQMIRREEGGYLAVWDTYAKAMLEIRPYSIPQDELISMALPEGDMLVVGVGDGITFGPPGLTFDPSSILKVSGRKLDLPSGEELYLYCWNESKGFWEDTGQRASVEIRDGITTITSEVPHFSRYAWGNRP